MPFHIDRCAAGQQLASLCGLQLLKEMQRKKIDATGTAYCLTDAGRQRSVEIRDSGEAALAAPLHHHRRVGSAERGAVILLVDEREGGGAAHHLGELCDALARHGCRFETRTLRTGLGDYQFVLADGAEAGARERALPRIIERKSAADVAASIKDGRWHSQQAAMRRTSAERFNGRAILEYIIEGDVAKLVHECAACTGLDPLERGVGGCPIRAGYPSVATVEASLQRLRSDSAYKVTKTNSLLATAAYLASERRAIEAAQPPPAPSSPSPPTTTAGAAAPAAADAKPSAASQQPLAGQLSGRGEGGMFASSRPNSTPATPYRPAVHAAAHAAAHVKAGGGAVHEGRACPAATPQADSARKAAPKRKQRAATAADGEPKKPRREPPHKATKPPKPPGVSGLRHRANPTNPTDPMMSLAHVH